MSALKKPTPVSRLVSPTPVSKISSPPPSSSVASGLKSPTSRPSASPSSPSPSPPSPAPSTASTASSSSDASSDYPEYEDRPFSSLDDAERIQSLLPSSATNENVCVCVRIRPLNAMERSTRQLPAWSVKDGIIFQSYVPETTSKSNPKPQSYMYDNIFTEGTLNEEVYKQIGEPILNNCMQGYHGCLFAYGQTSSGKTHTIHGTGEDPGMIPLSVEGIFDSIQAMTDRVFTLRVSYLEIYNEIINDLLEPLNTNLQIREDKKKGVYCERLKEDTVMAPEQVFSLLAAGESHRHVGKTNYNEQSSRSHTIFRMVLESQAKNAGKNSPVRTSILNLVDLAGSENAVKAGSVSRVKETGFINRSLLTLGHVISKLAERNLQHIPYRDSKLTRILQSSLSGKACVAVVCNISPSSGNLEETISTLKFASRAKKMKSSAQINETQDQSALLNQYRAEIDRLKEELERYKSMPHPPSASPSTSSTEAPNSPTSPSDLSSEELEQEEEEINQAALNAQIEQLTRMILTSESVAGEARDLVGGGPSPSAAAAAEGPHKYNPRTSNASLRGKKGASFKSPYATLNRSLSSSSYQQAAAAAAPASSPSPTSSSASASGPASSPSTSPAAAPAADDESTLISPPSLSSSSSPPLSSPSHSRRNSFSRLYVHGNNYADWDQAALIARINDLEAGNRQLHEALQQKEKDLKDWEVYYVQVNNKNVALENRIKAITSTHTEKLQQAISRRTSQIQPQATGKGLLANVPEAKEGRTKGEEAAAAQAATAAPAGETPADEQVMLEEGKKLMNELNELFDSYDSNSLIN